MLAISDTLRNRMIVTRMAIHSSTMTIRPPNGDFNPKKTTDHNTFSRSCTMNTDRALVTCIDFVPWRQIRNIAMPMNKYNTTQTGPKSQLGGLNAGFSRVAYHVGIWGIVKNEPTTPASSHTAMLRTNRQISGRRNLFVILRSTYCFSILPMNRDLSTTLTENQRPKQGYEIYGRLGRSARCG